MCRTTDFHQGFYERDRLKIKAFLVRLSGLNLDAAKSLPESLTLLYLPRINGSPLEIEGNKIRPGFPGFVTLHRVVGAKNVVFASREKVRASEGACFEVYLGEEKALKGIFRKDEGQEWKLECKCALEGEAAPAVKEAEVFVAAEDVGTMRERVEMVVKRKRKGVCELEEIPEEREGDGEWEEEEREDCCCSCSCSCSCEEDNEETEDEEERERVEMEAEEVGWAVDVGIWVVCLGVGYLVSRASARRLLRRKLL